METGAAAVVHSPPSSESLYDVGFCMWKDLSYSECESLLNPANGHDCIKSMLKDIMKIDVAMETSSQAHITTDLYAYGVIFGRQNNYSPTQLSTLISILKRVHEACICTPFDNLDATMKMFQELMVKHSVERPPHSSSVFNIAQVKAITDYLLTTYIKHFKLYKFAFTKKVRLNLLLGPQSCEVDEQEMESSMSNSKVAVEEGTEEQQQQVAHTCTDETSPTKKKEQTSDESNTQISDEHSKLKSLINSTINEKLEQIQATLQTNMQKQEEELLARIASLEQTATGDTKQANKKKSK